MSLSLDPRGLMIEKSLKRFRVIIPIVNPKGGVGKSTLSALLALGLARLGLSVGLLDIDLTNPTLHLILGLSEGRRKPLEDKGLKPLLVTHRLEFASPALFTPPPLPMRGNVMVDALRELLALFDWNSDIMIVDTPPGYSDELIEFYNLVSLCGCGWRTRSIVVTTPDDVALEGVRRLADLYKGEGVRLLGLIGNMCKDVEQIIALKDFASSIPIEYLGCVPYIDRFRSLSIASRDLLSVFSYPIISVVRSIAEKLEEWLDGAGLRA